MSGCTSQAWQSIRRTATRYISCMCLCSGTVVSAQHSRSKLACGGSNADRNPPRNLASAVRTIGCRHVAYVTRPRSRLGVRPRCRRHAVAVAKGGTKVSSDCPGELVGLPNGRINGFRATSKSEPPPSTPHSWAAGQRDRVHPMTITARRIDRREDLVRAQRAVSAVLLEPSTVGPRFGPRAPVRDVLHPVERDVEVDVRIAISEAANGWGPVYITTIGRWEERGFDSRDHWIVDDLREFDLYDQLDALGWNHLSESLIYDTGGRWGMLVAFEAYAIVFGDSSFVRTLRALVPPRIMWGVQSLRAALGPPRPAFDFSWIDELERALQA